MTFETYGLIIGAALCLYVADSVGRRHLGSGQVLAACLAAIFALTLLPAHGPGQAQLRPGESSPLGDLANLLLYAPLGAVLSLRRWSVSRAVLAAFALSVAIELAQLAIPGRTSSTDDVICNTAGAALGWVLARALWSRLRA